MAKLTPPAKGLIALAIIAVCGALAWQFALKDLLSGDKKDPIAKPGDDTTKPSGNDNAGKNLGSKDNPLKVSIVSFHGYAPALLANGSSLKTQAGSDYDKLGTNVELVIQDDIPTLATVFESGAAQCAWRTSDFWAQEQPNLRNAGLDGRAVIIVDNTQGADAIITTNPAIKKVEDLAGKKIALLQYTPSDGMVIDAVESSSLSARKKKSVDYVYINVDEGTAGVRSALTSGQVDAAALWDPDLSLAMKESKNARVIYSTKTATNLIFDVMVCDSRVLNDPANTQTIQNFVQGWLEAVPKARANPDAAVDALVNNEEFFKLLAKDQGKDFVKSLFANIVWTGLDDNARILGLAGGTDHYSRVYKRFDKIYRTAGALANPKSPVINPKDSFDMRFINALLAKDATAKEAAKKPQFEFTDTGRNTAATHDPMVTKIALINFATGKAELTKRAQQLIDTDVVPLIENNGAAYFELSGNTDSTGSKALNRKLSKQRAQAVVNYLVTQWEFPKSRFVTKGNGSAKPLCNEKKPAGEGLTLEECRARNRTTRLAVLSR